MDDGEAVVANEDDRHAIGEAQHHRNAGDNADDRVATMCHLGAKALERGVVPVIQDTDAAAVDLVRDDQSPEQSLPSHDGKGAAAVLHDGRRVVPDMRAKVEALVGGRRHATRPPGEGERDPAPAALVTEQGHAADLALAKRGNGHYARLCFRKSGMSNSLVPNSLDEGREGLAVEVADEGDEGLGTGRMATSNDC